MNNFSSQQIEFFTKHTSTKLRVQNICYYLCFLFLCAFSFKQKKSFLILEKDFYSDSLSSILFLKLDVIDNGFKYNVIPS